MVGFRNRFYCFGFFVFLEASLSQFPKVVSEDRVSIRGADFGRKMRLLNFGFLPLRSSCFYWKLDESFRGRSESGLTRESGVYFSKEYFLCFEGPMLRTGQLIFSGTYLRSGPLGIFCGKNQFTDISKFLTCQFLLAKKIVFARNS